MKAFYVLLLVTYLGWISWYGGSGSPVQTAELEGYISALQANVDPRGKDSVEPIKYMRTLAESDDGAEFIMVNLIRYRDRAMYPADSPWSKETDPMLADARYGAGVVPLLLKRGSLPVFISSVNGGFINETTHGEWDMVAMVRYRSVRDMLQMMVEISSTDLADHKWAAIEQTHVFPVTPKISLISLRLIIGIILLLFATAVRYLVNLRNRKNSQVD